VGESFVWRDVGDIRLNDVAGPAVEQPTNVIVRLNSSAIYGNDQHCVCDTMTGMKLVMRLSELASKLVQLVCQASTDAGQTGSRSNCDRLRVRRPATTGMEFIKCRTKVIVHNRRIRNNGNRHPV